MGSTLIPCSVAALISNATALAGPSPQPSEVTARWKAQRPSRPARHSACIARGRVRLLGGREFDRGELLLALAESVDAMVTAAAADNLAAYEQLFAERLGLINEQVEVQARDTVRGRLTDINFERLLLDGHTAISLAIVRSLARG